MISLPFKPFLHSILGIDCKAINKDTGKIVYCKYNRQASYHIDISSRHIGYSTSKNQVLIDSSEFGKKKTYGWWSAGYIL